MGKLIDDIMYRALSNPNAIFLHDQQGPTTAIEVVRQIEVLAQQLSIHCEQGLALIADNSSQWVVADLAALLAEKYVVPIPAFFTPEQALHALSTSGCDLVLVDEPSRAGVEKLLSNLSSSVAVTLTLNNLSGFKLENNCAQKPHTGTAKITYTSGTTGKPKGVCLSEAAMSAVADSLLAATHSLELRSHLCTLPLGVLLENIAGVYAPLLAGATCYLPDLQSLGYQSSNRLDAATWFNCLTHYSPDSMLLMPETLRLLLKGVAEGSIQPNAFKFLALGGGKTHEQLVMHAIASGLPVHEGYGLSECCSVVSLNRPGNNRPGTVGTPLPHCRIDVLDNNELSVNSTSIMLGYLGEAPISNNQISTGDLGSIDASGHVHIEGRKKQVFINSFGRNFSPEWIESHAQLAPIIGELIVFGDGEPFVTALVHFLSNDLNEQQHAIAQINEQLPDYARILAWHTLPIPLRENGELTTANGRPKRHDILKHYQHIIRAMYEKENHADGILQSA